MERGSALCGFARGGESLLDLLLVWACADLQLLLVLPSAAGEVHGSLLEEDPAWMAVLAAGNAGSGLRKGTWGVWCAAKVLGQGCCGCCWRGCPAMLLMRRPAAGSEVRHGDGAADLQLLLVAHREEEMLVCALERRAGRLCCCRWCCLGARQGKGRGAPVVGIWVRLV